MTGEHQKAEAKSSKEVSRPESPQRFFLNAPKQKDGECYVLNWDYMELDAYCVSLLRERDRLREHVAIRTYFISDNARLRAALEKIKARAQGSIWAIANAALLPGEMQHVETACRFYACCDDECKWSGPEASAVHPKHDPAMLCCPDCGEVVELIPAQETSPTTSVTK